MKQSIRSQAAACKKNIGRGLDAANRLPKNDDGDDDDHCRQVVVGLAETELHMSLCQDVHML